MGLEKRTASLLRERERIGQMRRMETELIESGISPVAGVDEAGRGPLKKVLDKPVKRCYNLLKK